MAMMARARIVVSLELICLQSLAALIYREGKMLWPGKKFMWGAVASRNRGEICDRFRLRWSSLTARLAAPPLPDPKIGRGLFAAIALNLVLDGLSLVERTQPGPLDSRDVD